jgi:hypothetical protein
VSTIVDHTKRLEQVVVEIAAQRLLGELFHDLPENVEAKAVCVNWARPLATVMPAAQRLLGLPRSTGPAAPIDTTAPSPQLSARLFPPHRACVLSWSTRRTFGTATPASLRRDRAREQPGAASSRRKPDRGQCLLYCAPWRTSGERRLQAQRSRLPAFSVQATPSK